MAESTTPGEPPATPRRHLHRLPLPRSEPPYDDEIGATPPPERRGRRSPEAAPTQGALALSITTSGGVASAPEPHPRLRLVGDDEGRPEPHAAARKQTPALPDPRRWTAKLTQAVIEAIHGQRPVQQLIRWTDERVYRDLARRAGRRSATPASRPRVRALRVCRVNETVAEASAVVQLGPLPHAVALRLEAVDGRWLCTVFEVIDRGNPISRRTTPPRRPWRSRTAPPGSGGTTPRRSTR